MTRVEAKGALRHPWPKRTGRRVDQRGAGSHPGAGQRFVLCVCALVEPISEWKSVLAKALVGLMLGCKMASQTCEPALLGGGEITGGIDACLFSCIKLCL